MKRCLLWGTGTIFENYVSVARYYELKGMFTIVGVTSSDNVFSQIDGLDYIEKNRLVADDYDLVIVMAGGNALIEIQKEITAIGIDEDRIIPYMALGVIGFNVDKYRELRKNPPSIFSLNCWGGLTYHSLGLQFSSPFINMFMDPEDFLELVEDPKRYLEYEITDGGYGIDENSGKEYPIGDCNGLKLHFNHYDVFETAKADWDKRKARVNWENIIVSMFDDDIEILERFSRLNYKKKVCFTTVETKLDSVESIQKCKELSSAELWEMVNRMASRRWLYYDVFELLNNGKIKRISMNKG